MIRDIKFLKMLTKFNIQPDDETKIQIVHCLKNIIDLDELFNLHGLKTKKTNNYMDEFNSNKNIF